MALAQEKPYFWEYDSAIFPKVDKRFFTADYWQSSGQVIGKETGRGTTWFVQHGERELVLRHYLRGGLVGRMNKDRYLFNGLNETRSFHEYRILLALQDQRLPVPRPVAAQTVRSGLFYRADLIMERIPNTKDLVSVLQKPQTDDFYQELGAFIATFHLAGVYHADLNIKNILQDDKQKFWLIDFDRAQLKTPIGAKQERSIARLKRSVEKETLRSGIHVTQTSWHKFEQAYRKRVSKH